VLTALSNPVRKPAEQKPPPTLRCRLASSTPAATDFMRQGPRRIAGRRGHGRGLFRVPDGSDFLGVHAYPVWEGRTIDAALANTVENIEAVRTALPGRRTAELEAGWPKIASEFGDQASEVNQARHYAELRQWAVATNTTVFFFEAFDEE